jgi:hypothetical protein
MGSSMLRRAGLGVLLSVVTTTLAIGGAAAATTPTHASTAASTKSVNCGTEPTGPREFTDFRSCLAKQYPDNYGGMYVSGGASNTEWTLVEVHHTLALESAAVNGLHRVHVSFKLAPYPYAHLEAVAKKIDASRASLATLGVTRLSAKVNQETNNVTVSVTVRRTQDNVRRYFTRHFPKVVKVSVTPPLHPQTETGPPTT